jgi:hypothetical protein
MGQRRRCQPVVFRDPRERYDSSVTAAAADLQEVVSHRAHLCREGKGAVIWGRLHTKNESRTSTRSRVGRMIIIDTLQRWMAPRAPPAPAAPNRTVTP